LESKWKICGGGGIREMNDWRPIRTCPDNTTVLFYDNGPKIGRMEHDTLRMGGFKKDHFWGGPFDDDIPPTHWMPLPDPPTTEQEKKTT